MRNLVLWSAFWMLLSCAKQPVRDPVQQNVEQVLTHLHQVERPQRFHLNPGPSLVTEALFQEDESFDLKRHGALSLNVVDYNQDGYQDLVLWDGQLSIPRFLSFNQKQKKFKDESISFFTGSAPTGSFAKIVDLNHDQVLDMVVATYYPQSPLTPEASLKVFWGEKKAGLWGLGKMQEFTGLWWVSSILLVDQDGNDLIDLFASFGPWPKNLEGKTLVKQQKIFNRLFTQYDQQGPIFEEVILGDEKKYNREREVYPYAHPGFMNIACDTKLNGRPSIIVSSTDLGPTKTYQWHVDEKGQASSYQLQFLAEEKKEGRLLFCLDHDQDGTFELVELNPQSPIKEYRPGGVWKGMKFTPWYLGDGREQDFFPLQGQALDVDGDGHDEFIILPEKTQEFSTLEVWSLKHGVWENRAKEFGLDLLNPVSLVILDANNDSRPDLLVAQKLPYSSDRQLRLMINYSKQVFYQLSLPLQKTGLAIEIKTNQKRKKLFWSDPFAGHVFGQHQSSVFFALKAGDFPKEVILYLPQNSLTFNPKVRQSLDLKARRVIKKMAWKKGVKLVI